jgi:hypothetical protein
MNPDGFVDTEHHKMEMAMAKVATWSAPGAKLIRTRQIPI